MLFIDIKQNYGYTGRQSMCRFFSLQFKAAGFYTCNSIVKRTSLRTASNAKFEFPEIIFLRIFFLIFNQND